MGPGAGQSWQKFPKHALIVTSPPENKKTFFFRCQLEDLLNSSAEGLNSSLALAAGDLWPKKGWPILVVKGLIRKECPEKLGVIMC